MIFREKIESKLSPYSPLFTAEQMDTLNSVSESVLLNNKTFVYFKPQC